MSRQFDVAFAAYKARLAAAEAPPTPTLSERARDGLTWMCGVAFKASVALVVAFATFVIVGGLIQA